MRLAKKYANERLEAAATKALAIGSLSYKSVNSILEKGLDQQPVQSNTRVTAVHENIRGAAYYGKETD